MGRRKNKTNKNKKKKSLRKTPRQAHVVTNIRNAYAKKINKKVELKPDTMRNEISTVRLLRPKDKQQISYRQNVINRPVLLKSDSIEAYSWTEQKVPKIMIKDLGKITDENFGVTDTIHAIIQKAEVQADSLDDIQIYVNANSTEELNSLTEELKETDPDLFKKVIFIRSLDAVRSDVSSSGRDNNDDNDNNAPVPRARPVIDSKKLIQTMREHPKSNLLVFKRSDKYKKIIDALDNYHSQLDNYSGDIEVDGDDLGLYNKHKKELDNIVADLNKKIDLYISESNSQDSDAEKDVKKEAMEVLQDQLFNIQRNDTNADMNRIREAFWLKKYKPLTDDKIDNTAQEIVLGEGAQGQVKTVTYKGPPPFVAALKIDSPEKSNEPSRDAGIPKETHEQSKRAVASYNMSKLLNMTIIPETRLIVRTNKDTGKIEFGQAMKMVDGIVGQRTIKETQIDPEVVKSWGMDPAEMELSPDQKYYPATGEVWKIRREAPPNVDLSKSVVQRDLSELQILDNVIGHADRHGENFIFVTRPYSNEVIGVQGIDNDDTFGSKWRDLDHPDELGKSSKTPGLPPVIDLHTAIRLLTLSPYNAFVEINNGLKENLPPDDIEKFIERLLKMQDDLKTKIGDGTIKIATTEDKVLNSQIKTMESAIGDELQNTLKGKILKWGDQTINLHTPDNSYLGVTKAAQPVADDDDSSQ